MRTPGTDESLVVTPNNATQISLTFDDNRLASQLGIIPLLDGRVEGVHVDVSDFTDGHGGFLS